MQIETRGRLQDRGIRGDTGVERNAEESAGSNEAIGGIESVSSKDVGGLTGRDVSSGDCEGPYFAWI